MNCPDEWSSPAKASSTQSSWRKCNSAPDCIRKTNGDIPTQFRCKCQQYLHKNTFPSNYLFSFVYDNLHYALLLVWKNSLRACIYVCVCACVIWMCAFVCMCRCVLIVFIVIVCPVTWTQQQIAHCFQYYVSSFYIGCKNIVFVLHRRAKHFNFSAI